MESNLVCNHTSVVNCFMSLWIEIGWFKLQFWMWLFRLNYSFECDWLIELSDNKLSNYKLSDNNLASELVENRSFWNQSQSRKLWFLWLCGTTILYWLQYWLTTQYKTIQYWLTLVLTKLFLQHFILKGRNGLEKGAFFLRTILQQTAYYKNK